MNPGVYPIDPTTPVGQLRYTIGDTAGTPITDPEQPGMASYAVFSDAALTAALAVAGGSVYGAAGDLMLQLATFYAQQGNHAVKADDLGLTISNRGSDLVSIAKSFHEQARHAKAAADEAESDFFIFAPINDPCWTPPSFEPADATYDGGTP